MNSKSHSSHVFVLLAALLLFGAAAATHAQTCAEKLDLARQRVQGLEQQISDQKDLTAAQEKKLNDQKQVIDLQDQKIDKQREKIDLQQSKIDDLNSKVEQLQKQIALLEDDRKLLQQNVQSQQSIAQLSEQFIAVQSKAIDALVKTSKRSALEKLVDSLPAIAGIIAVALEHK
jgi:chromosome segregation ATPase